MSTRLSLLVELASLLSREVDLDALLRMACEKVAEALSAERATIWLVDADAHELASRVAILPERATGLTIPLGRGVAGTVAQSGRSIRIDDAQADARFDPSVDRETGYQTRSMIAAPIREEAASPVRGVLQVLKSTTAFTREGPAGAAGAAGAGGATGAGLDSSVVVGLTDVVAAITFCGGGGC